MKKLFYSFLQGFGITGPITLVLVLVNTENLSKGWPGLWIKSWIIAGTLATIITGYIQPWVKRKFHQTFRKPIN